MVYVCDRGNYSIEVMERATGNYVGGIGRVDSGDFEWPVGVRVAVDQPRLQQVKQRLIERLHAVL